MTDAELAILSLLSEKPSYDHDLNREIEARGLRRWTAIGTSSMYYVLDKLEKQGLIRRVPEETTHRKFQISPAGIGVLQTSVADLLGTPRAYDKGFELGVANLHILKSSQVQSALLSRQQDLITQVNKLRDSLQTSEVSESFQAKALFSHRIAMIEAELKWLEVFIHDWEEQAPTDPELKIEAAMIPRSRQVILPQDPDSIHKASTRDVGPARRPTPPSQNRRTEYKARPTPPGGSEPAPKKDTKDSDEG